MKELYSSIKNLPRHLKTAFQNLWRNGVMSFSSIVAVTITLLLVGTVGLIAVNVQGITTSIEDGVRIYVKLDQEIDDEQGALLQEQIDAIHGVKSSAFSTKDQELDKLIEGYGDDGTIFDSYRGEENPLGAAYEVEVNDPSEIATVATNIENIIGVNDATYGGDSTSNMVETLNLIQNTGTMFIVALLVVAIFMIMNTIKITITTRQVEISIMRMVGASNWYIRIPFMLEGLLIGVIGSIVPIVGLLYGYNVLYNMAGGTIISASLPLLAPFPVIAQYSLILAGLGAVVGLIGSFISIRRFLKF